MAMVVAQLAERVLPVPLVRSLNPISDIIKQFSTNCNIEKTKIKKCPIFKRAAITGNQNALSTLKVQLGTKTVTLSYLVLLELRNRQTPGAYTMKLYSAVI